MEEKPGELGAGFPLGLAMNAWRTPDGAASAATSSLAFGVGPFGRGRALIPHDPVLVG